MDKKNPKHNIILPKNYIRGEIILGNNQDKSFFPAKFISKEKQDEIRKRMEEANLILNK